ncbi:hypothetical protein, partial [Seonamhaeicola algicola]|uniref:hypothetical protein n=1 Tax=Seonamhaeicola algicola TaxID=1719036 RepID=UPI00164C144B
ALEEETARKRVENLKAQRSLDSIARIKEFERKKQALVREKAIKKAEALREKKRLEAIAKDEAEERNNSKKINIKALERQKYRSTCHYVMNEFDNLYQEKVIMTKAYKIDDGLKAELYKKGKRIDLFLTSNINIGCVSGFSNKNTYVKISLENGTSVILYHTYGTSCSGFEFKGKLANNYVETLKNSPIKSITLKGTKGSKEIINIDYKEFFIDKLKCVE